MRSIKKERMLLYGNRINIFFFAQTEHFNCRQVISNQREIFTLSFFWCTPAFAPSFLQAQICCQWLSAAATHLPDLTPSDHLAMWIHWVATDWRWPDRVGWCCPDLLTGSIQDEQKGGLKFVPSLLSKQIPRFCGFGSSICCVHKCQQKELCRDARPWWVVQQEVEVCKLDWKSLDLTAGGHSWLSKWLKYCLLIRCNSALLYLRFEH